MECNFQNFVKKNKSSWLQQSYLKVKQFIERVPKHLLTNFINGHLVKVTK